jgi:hypothetical protein
VFLSTLRTYSFEATLALTAVVLLSGCVAPGSTIGRLGLSGTLAGGDDPLSMQVTLPKHYGLGGLDLVLNRAEDFGNRDQTVTVEVKDGAFSHEFPPVVYHVSVWLLPPLGAFPRQPPEPVYQVSFSDAPNEVYLIGIDRGGFRYDTFDKSTRQKLKPEAASWRITKGEYVPIDQKNRIWHLRIEGMKSNRVINRNTR